MPEADDANNTNFVSSTPTQPRHSRCALAAEEPLHALECGLALMWQAESIHLRGLGPLDIVNYLLPRVIADAAAVRAALFSKPVEAPIAEPWRA